MMGSRHRLQILIILVILLINGCTVGKGSGIFPPAADINAQPPVSADDDGRDYKIFIANGLSENITHVERTNGVWNVTQDVLQTGIAPSHMVLHDGLCYIVNSLSNSIQVVDPALLTIIHEISTGAGTNPKFMAFVTDSTALVTCYLSNEVLLVDLDSGASPENQILKSIILPDANDLPSDTPDPTYARPGGIVIVDNKAFAACSNLNSMHEAGGQGIVIEIALPACEISSVIELSGRDTTQVIHSPRFPERLIVMSAGDHTIEEGFKGNGIVESIDLNSGEIFQVIEVDGSPFGGEIGADDILFLENGLDSSILRVDLKTGEVLENFNLPTYGISLSYASSLVALPGLILATNFNTDRLYLLEPLTGEVLAELQTGDGPDAMVLVEQGE